MSRIGCLLISLWLVASPPAPAADLYVAPDGDDTADGSKARPLRSLEAARDAVRKLKRRSNVTVWLRGGVYHRTKPFTLGSEDSGGDRDPIEYRAFPGEPPVFLGGRFVRPADARKPAAAVLRRLPAAARPHVVEIDAKALGLQHLGPWPDLLPANSEIVQLVFDNKRLPLARWPNDGPATLKEVLDPGVEKGLDRRGGTFVYRDDRHASWPVEAGVWLAGDWRGAGKTEIVRVKAIDVKKMTVTLSEPVAGGLGAKDAGPRGSGKEPYRVVNLLEELDQPGEWCLDFRTGKLYLWPPAALKPGSLVIIDLHGPMIQCRGTSYVIIRGLNLLYGIGNGLEINGGKNLRIIDCSAGGFAGSGVMLGGEGTVVSGGGTFFWTKELRAVILGEDPSPDPR